MKTVGVKAVDDTFKVSLHGGVSANLILLTVILSAVCPTSASAATSDAVDSR